MFMTSLVTSLVTSFGLSINWIPPAVLSKSLLENEQFRGIERPNPTEGLHISAGHEQI